MTALEALPPIVHAEVFILFMACGYDFQLCAAGNVCMKKADHEFYLALPYEIKPTSLVSELVAMKRLETGQILAGQPIRQKELMDRVEFPINLRMKAG